MKKLTFMHHAIRQLRAKKAIKLTLQIQWYIWRYEISVCTNELNIKMNNKSNKTNYQINSKEWHFPENASLQKQKHSQDRLHTHKRTGARFIWQQKASTMYEKKLKKMSAQNIITGKSQKIVNYYLSANKNLISSLVV